MHHSSLPLGARAFFVLALAACGDPGDAGSLPLDHGRAPDAGVGGDAGSDGMRRVLPLGDSITLGVPHTYRYALARALSERGQEVDFVGSVQGSDGIYPDGWDQDHEGHSGWSVGDIDAELEGWLRGYTADVALVHLGTNDVAAVREGEISLAESEASMRGIVAKLRAQNPRVAIVLAQILPYGGEFASFNATVDDWNRRLVVLASALTTADSPVSVVDMNTGFGEGDLDEDGIHPSAAGAARMAGVWADALR